MKLGDEDYSSGDSEQDTSQINFKTLSKLDKEDHVRELWRKCWLKASGCSFLVKYFGKLNERIIMYGSSKNLSIGLEDKLRYIESKKPWIVLMPDCKFLYLWNVIMIILLFYCGTYLPYRIAFF